MKLVGTSELRGGHLSVVRPSPLLILTLRTNFPLNLTPHSALPAPRSTGTAKTGTSTASSYQAESSPESIKLQTPPRTLDSATVIWTLDSTILALDINMDRDGRGDIGSKLRRKTSFVSSSPS